MRTRDREKLNELENKLYVQKLLFKEEYERMHRSLIAQDGLEGSGYKSCSDSNYLLRELKYKINTLSMKFENLKNSLIIQENKSDHYTLELERRKKALDEAYEFRHKIKEAVDYSIVNRKIEQLSGLGDKLTIANKKIAQRLRSYETWKARKSHIETKQLSSPGVDVDEIINSRESKIKNFMDQYSNQTDLSTLSTKVDIQWEP